MSRCWWLHCYWLIERDERIGHKLQRHRFPPQVISHAVWLYFRFPLSLRLVEEMLLERGMSCLAKPSGAVAASSMQPT